MTAKKTIDAAWLDGPSYDLATQAAEALESAQLLQSPETAAELHTAGMLAAADLIIVRPDLDYGPDFVALIREKVQEKRSRTTAGATPALTIYRAQWDSMPMGWYTSQAEARKHCEAHARRDLPTAVFDWIEDEEDGVAELVAEVEGDEGPTGYLVTAMEIASKYDPEADE